MDLTTFLTQRRPDWRRLEEILARVEGSGLRSLDDDQAAEFGQLYRRIASDLNQAQTFVHGDATVQYLNDLVARCYFLIYARGKVDWRGLVRYLVWEYPAVFRRYVGYFLLATAIFTAGMVFGAVAEFYDAETAWSYLMPAGMSPIQPHKDDSAEERVAMTGELA